MHRYFPMQRKRTCLHPEVHRLQIRCRILGSVRHVLWFRGKRRKCILPSSLWERLLRSGQIRRSRSGQQRKHLRVSDCSNCLAGARKSTFILPAPKGRRCESAFALPSRFITQLFICFTINFKFNNQSILPMKAPPSSSCLHTGESEY